MKGGIKVTMECLLQLSDRVRSTQQLEAARERVNNYPIAVYSIVNADN